MRDSLLNRISAMQIFQVLRFAGLLGVSVLLARSTLDMGSIGVFEGLLLLSGLSGFFWIGGMMNTLVPLYARAAEEERKALLSSAFRSAMLLNILLVGLLLLFPGLFNLLVGWSAPQSEIWLPFCAFVLFNNPAFLTEYLYLMRGESRSLAGYGAAVLILQILGIALPLMAGLGLTGCLYGLAIGALLRWLWMLKLLGTEVLLAPAGEWSRKHGLVAMPLAGSLLFGGMGAYIDGLIVSHSMGSEQLAIFRYGAREFPLVLLLANAFSSAASADVAGDLKQALAMIRRRSTRMLNALMPLTLLLLFSSAWWFPRLFRPDFAPAHSVFNIYLLLIIPRLMFPQTILTGLGRTGVLLRVSAFELALNTGLSLALIGPMGMEGVALATVVAHITDKLLLVWRLHLREQISPTAYLPWQALVGYSLILALGFYLLG